jgi:hypothetical protein
LNLLKTGGVLVSAVSAAPQPKRSDVHSVFFYVEVTTERLNLISQLLDLGQLTTRVGSVLPLKDIRTAHKMLPERRINVERSFCRLPSDRAHAIGCDHVTDLAKHR